MAATPSPAPHARSFAPAIVVVVGLAAWWGVWSFGYKFDDRSAIVTNAPLLAGDWWNASLGDQHQPLANRPLAAATLALPFAWFGPGPASAMIGNLVLHLANGVLLWALARRLLRASAAAASAESLALVVACLWVAHPLGADAVAYATQRSTLVANGCFLASVLALAQAAATGRWRWTAAAAVAMAAAMASKEDLVGGPLLAVAFDRAFLAPDWRAVGRRWRTHLAIAGAWLVLAACVLLGPSNPTVGFATREAVTAWEWLMTQAGVLVDYAKAVFWPWPLRGAHDTPMRATLADAWLPGLVVMAALAATAAAWPRRPALAWLGTMFFVLLAPTSSVMPIVTEVVAERRVYLPMLALLVPAVLGVRALLRRLPPPRAQAAGATLAVLAVVVAVALARAAAAPYATEAAFWRHAYEHRDPTRTNTFTARILGSHAAMLYAAGRATEAYELWDAMMQCEDPTLDERLQWVSSLYARGRHEECVAAMDRLLADEPRFARARVVYGGILVGMARQQPKGPGDPRLLRAVEELRLATTALPASVTAWTTLGNAHEFRRDWPAAEAAYRRATELPFESTAPFLGLASALRRQGRGREFAAVLSARPDDLVLRVQLAEAIADEGDRAGAIELCEQVLRREPRAGAASELLAKLRGQGR